MEKPNVLFRLLNGVIVKLKGATIQRCIQKFLFRYHITPHPATNVAPFELLMNRKPRCQLDLIMPDTSVKFEKRQDTIMDKKEKQARSIVLGDAVYVRDFSARDTQWIPGEITKVTGPRSYHVLLKDGKTIRQHIDNITKRVVSKNSYCDTKGHIHYYTILNTH